MRRPRSWRLATASGRAASSPISWRSRTARRSARSPPRRAVRRAARRPRLGLAGLERHQQLTLLDGVADRHGELAHDPVDLGQHLVLHLHRLEHDHGVPARTCASRA